MVSITLPTLHHQTQSVENARVELEDDGVYRITMPSLTGIGTHTRWFYPEEPVLQRGRVEEKKDFSSNVDKRVMSPLRGCPVSRIRASTNATRCFEFGRSSRSNALRRVEQWEEYNGSDATELVDEEEREPGRGSQWTEEEPLPDLPYERLMKRISQEPTVILDDDI